MQTKAWLLLALSVCLFLNVGLIEALHLWEVDTPQTPMAQFFEQHPWLLERSAWAEYVQNPDPVIFRTAERASFGIGNGYTFAMVGIGYPLNSLHELCGPDYEGKGPFFSDIASKVKVNGKESVFRQEWAWWVKDTGIVITKGLTAENIALYTVDYAPLGMTAMVRITIVSNESSDIAANLELFSYNAGEAWSKEGRYIVERRGNSDEYAYLSAEGVYQASGNQLSIWIGDLMPGQERLFYQYIVTADSGIDHKVVEAGLLAADKLELLEQVRDYFRSWRSQLARLHSPDPKVNQLLDVTLIINKLQTAYRGGIGPMSRYTIYNIRDDHATVRLYARLGLYEDIRNSLDYHFKACWKHSSMSNSIGLDVDIDNLPPEPDWSQIEIMEPPSRNKTEAPNYVILKYYDYYRTTGDLPFIERRYEFLRQWLVDQEHNEDWLFKLSKDEAWRWVFFIATLYYEPENFIWSAYSSFLYVVACRAMEHFAMLLDKPDDLALFREYEQAAFEACERWYWLADKGFYSPGVLFSNSEPLLFPFEDINTLPLYIGYLPYHHPRMLSNLQRTIDYLWRPDGTIQSPPRAITLNLEPYDGMMPGQLVYSLAVTDHPKAEAAFNAIDLIAQDSGEVAEGQNHYDHSVAMLTYSPVGDAVDGDITARFRPWEGSAVLEGMMEYLTGLHTDIEKMRVDLFPHLPNGWGSFTVTDNRISDTRYDLMVADDGGVYRASISNKGSEDFNLCYKAALGYAQPDRVAVDGEPLPIDDCKLERLWGRTQLTLPLLSVPGGITRRIDIEYTSDYATPTPLPSPTPTPTVAVSMAGWMGSTLSSQAGGVVNFLAITNRMAEVEVHLKLAGASEGIPLQYGSYGVYTLEPIAMGAGIPAGRFTFEVYAQSLLRWPYLKVYLD